MGNEPDWTLGPAKWIAVGVLGAASVAGMTWTIAQKYPPRREVVYMPAPQQPALQREVLAIADDPPEEVDRAGDLLQELKGDPYVTAVEAPRGLESAPAVRDADAEPRRPVERRSTYVRIININTASAAELELLPGIGPALAGRIIEYRQSHGAFRTVEDLTNVRGIGEKTLERLRPRIRTE